MGIEVKTKVKTTTSAAIINVQTQSIESLVNKYKKVLGNFSEFSLDTFYESCGFGKIRWIASNVVLELGLDKQVGSDRGGVSFEINRYGSFEYSYSKSVGFYTKDFFNSKRISGF